MRARRAALPLDEQTRASAALATQGLALPGLTNARMVASYVAMKGEIDPAPLCAALAALGVTIVLPRVSDRAARGLIAFHRATPEELVAGHFGLSEPPAHAPVVPLADIDVFLVPALCLDRRGVRIGWGKGHYDATLAQAPEAVRIGIAYDFQIVPVAPESSGDERMDVILTEAGALPTEARPESRWRAKR